MCFPLIAGRIVDKLRVHSMLAKAERLEELFKRFVALPLNADDRPLVFI